MGLTEQEVITRLGLIPHPREGGFFRETYRSREAYGPNLPVRYQGTNRNFSTAIYYLLTPQTCSRMHRLKSDEVFHFYLGDPVMMLQLHPDGTSRHVILGNNLYKGCEPQVIVPQGVWQGMFLVDGGSFALLGTTVSPGFDFQDYQDGVRADLLSLYPIEKEIILRLTE